jgi:S-adenosylmethionine decarboxylase
MPRGQDLETVLVLEPGVADLAPGIVRQRLVIEGTCPEKITEEQIVDYLGRLSGVCDMRALNDPVTHHSSRFGWAGWIHWETSGAHFYAWDDPIFFSVDLYTCKAFDPAAVVRFTAEYFDATEIVSFGF